MAIEGFKFTLGNLASQLHLVKNSKCEKKKNELLSLSFLTVSKSGVLVSKFPRPIHKEQQNTNSELSVAFILAFNLANSLQAEVPIILQVVVKDSVSGLRSRIPLLHISY